MVRKTFYKVTAVVPSNCCALSLLVKYVHNVINKSSYMYCTHIVVYTTREGGGASRLQRRRRLGGDVHIQCGARRQYKWRWRKRHQRRRAARRRWPRWRHPYRALRYWRRGYKGDSASSRRAQQRTSTVGVSCSIVSKKVSWNALWRA